MPKIHTVNGWKKFDFHGAFANRSDARRKVAETPRAFIREIKIRGQRRFSVVTRKLLPT